MDNGWLLGLLLDLAFKRSDRVLGVFQLRSQRLDLCLKMGCVFLLLVWLYSLRSHQLAIEVPDSPPLPLDDSLLRESLHGSSFEMLSQQSAMSQELLVLSHGLIMGCQVDVLFQKLNLLRELGVLHFKRSSCLLVLHHHLKVTGGLGMEKLDLSLEAGGALHSQELRLGGRC